MRKLYAWLLAFIILGIAIFLLLTSPAFWSMLHAKRDIAHNSAPDLDNGRVMFIASDCATCHATPDQKDHLKLGGGHALDAVFGRFYMPSISPDSKDGIGAWTLEQFTRAVREGVGKAGQNLYPAFPYTSYQRMTTDDIRYMFAYIQTQKPVSGPAPDHVQKFPFNIRRWASVWRLFFLDSRPLPLMQSKNPLVERGRYLVEGPGHCAGCHPARNFMGAIKAGMRYGGGTAPDGKGYFPNISRHETGIGFWAANSIVNYLRTGISPINKIAGGDMTEGNDMWVYSANVYNKSCGACHALPEKEHYRANQWIGNLNAMRRYTSLIPDQHRLLPGYLQNHSKDVSSAPENK